MLSWTGWPSTITDDCTRLWVTSVQCNTRNAGKRHSAKRLHKSEAKNCSIQGQGHFRIVSAPPTPDYPPQSEPAMLTPSKFRWRNEHEKRAALLVQTHRGHQVPGNQRQRLRQATRSCAGNRVLLATQTTVEHNRCYHSCTDGGSPAAHKFIALTVGDPVRDVARSQTPCTLVLAGGLRLEMSALPDPQWLTAVGRSAQGAY